MTQIRTLEAGDHRAASVDKAGEGLAGAVMERDGPIIYDVRNLHAGLLADRTAHSGLAKEPE